MIFLYRATISTHGVLATQQRAEEPIFEIKASVLAIAGLTLAPGFHIYNHFGIECRQWLALGYKIMSA
jgi:hypothetical protein